MEGGRGLVRKMSTNEANIEMNKILEDSEVREIQNGKMSVSEANMKINDEFYSNKQSGIAPTYINNETAAVRISGNDD
jgi:hypothetical protein